jgi:SAM-dependent methyltransferase
MDQPSRTISALENFERLYVKPVDGKTLIVGSRVYRDKEDRRKRYADVVGMDMQEGEGVDIVQDLEESLHVGQLRSFAHVECMSVLEHSRRPWLLAANIERMLRPGGSIYVTVPFV